MEDFIIEEVNPESIADLKIAVIALYDALSRTDSFMLRDYGQGVGPLSRHMLDKYSDAVKILKDNQ